MKRGMLTITQPALAQIVATLPVNPENQFLINKLQAGVTSGQDPVQILLNEEELDVMMDNLPIPTAEEDAALTEARQTVQTFLSQLRFG